MRLDAGDRAGARALFADALQRAPHFPMARLRLAGLLREEGEFAAAAAELRICLKQDPHCVAAWSDLVALSDGALSAPELEALLAACRQPGLADGPRTQLTLACGRALESRGRLREGYAMIATANAWRARDSDWDGARHARRCAAIAHAFEPHSASAADRNLGSEIVFIIDDAGAGADLEAALGAHARIAAGGELALLGELVAEESRRRGAAFPAWIAAATAADWQRLGGLYLQRSASLRTTKACSTDRSPALPLLLGAAAAMLPGARIIPRSLVLEGKVVGEVKQAKDDGRLPMEDHNTRVIVLAQDPAQARYVAEAIARETFHNVSYFPGTLDEARAAVPQ
jgi:hypothetical protein